MSIEIQVIPVPDDDDALRDLLRTLSPAARGHLREVLIQDQADRDVIAARLLRYRDERGMAWADLVDRLTLDPELRRRYVRLLGELEASP
jgi:hypothetical protein